MSLAPYQEYTNHGPEDASPYLSLSGRKIMKHPITLGGQSFPSKLQLKTWLQHVLWHTSEGQSPGQVAEAVLTDLLSFHPRQEEKVGPGIQRFIVQSFEGSRAFFIQRVDGSSIDFSFHKCLAYLSRTGSGRRFDVVNVFRRVIQPQIASYREQLPDPVMCALSGTPIPKTLIHVDHAWPHTFLALLEQFLAETGHTWESLPHQDPSIHTAWSLFHATHAVLRPLAPDINLSLSNREPVTGSP